MSQIFTVATVECQLQRFQCPLITLFIVGGKGLPPYGPCYAVGRQPFSDMDEQYVSNL